MHGKAVPAAGCGYVVLAWVKYTDISCYVQNTASKAIKGARPGDASCAPRGRRYRLFWVQSVEAGRMDLQDGG